jgi:hypothetical protein
MLQVERAREQDAHRQMDGGTHSPIHGQSRRGIIPSNRTGKEFDTTREEDGYVFEEIGECLLLLNRSEEASLYFARANTLLSQDPWLAEKEPQRRSALIN